MKKTVIATMMMTLVLIGTIWAQPKRKTPPQVGNPFGLGGTVTAGVKNRQPATFRKRIDKATPVANLGDTGTHEVGHKGNRRNGQFRPNPTGDGTTQQFRKSNTSGQNNDSRQSQLNTVNQPLSMKLGDIKGEVINSQQPKGAKYDGIDGESNDARTKKPNGQRKNNVSRTETVDNNESLMRRPNRRKR
ncbi:MAG: hypothetical protein JNM09_16150 [Blastocatellia bacterium]|nr:hypothetical protein [Blastocatellia bacterium]